MGSLSQVSPQWKHLISFSTSTLADIIKIYEGKNGFIT